MRGSSGLWRPALAPFDSCKECPKCGNDQMFVKYYKATPSITDYLAVLCGRCGHTRYTLTKDAE